MPNLPWFVYAMLLAPLALVLFAATYKSLQVRAARDWPSTPGKVVISDSQVPEVRVLYTQRADAIRLEPRNFANIVYQYSVSGKTLTNNRVSSARTAAILASRKPSRAIRSAPPSPSITIRSIRATRCWNAIPRKACGAASGSERRSRWRSCSARYSASIN